MLLNMGPRRPYLFLSFSIQCLKLIYLFLLIGKMLAIDAWFNNWDRFPYLWDHEGNEVLTDFCLLSFEFFFIISLLCKGQFLVRVERSEATDRGHRSIDHFRARPQLLQKRPTFLFNFPVFPLSFYPRINFFLSPFLR